jgi:hypothetical protein
MYPGEGCTISPLACARFFLTISSPSQPSKQCLYDVGGLKVDPTHDLSAPGVAEAVVEGVRARQSTPLNRVYPDRVRPLGCQALIAQKDRAVAPFSTRPSCRIFTIRASKD